MENKSVTAVEWLVNEIAEKYNFRFATYYGQEIQQAKEMDKEQKEYFFNCGRQYQLTGEGTFTEVYNETYKKD